MRAVKRWRYHCDHCRKSGGNKAAMARHETRCIYNHNRQCGFCGDNPARASWRGITVETGEPQPSRDLLVAAALNGLDELRKVARACPACMLAGIVAVRKIYADDGEDLPNSLSGWDYKQECTRFWKEVDGGLDF